MTSYGFLQQLADTAAAKVWCFAGDFEMDEPEGRNPRDA